MDARFAFVALELPWELGPRDGRYVLRGHAAQPTHVLVLRTLAASPRPRDRRRLRRAPRSTPGAADPTVPVVRATLIAATPLAGDEAARAWLRGADLEAEAARAVAVLNRVLQAHRIAAADPFVREIARGQALVVRVGYGTGEQVADGVFSDVRELPPAAGARERGRGGPRPEERLAALLGGRDVALAAEELTLRARLDLDRGRGREAALQLRVALEAALAELEAWSHRPELAARLAALRGERGAVAAAADRALEGGLDTGQLQDVDRVVRRLEAALAARVAGGFE
jgi:hypothetical protein